MEYRIEPVSWRGADRGVVLRVAEVRDVVVVASRSVSPDMQAFGRRTEPESGPPSAVRSNARSPLWEAVFSLRAVADPDATLHEPWAVAALSRLDGIDVETLLALWTPCAACPTTPPPLSSRPQFDEELRRVRATPPEQIRRDLQVTYRDSLPPGLESLYRRPGSGIDKLVRLVGAYWERALADHWPRLRLVLEGDVVYRTRALAAGGAMAVFDDLHERVAWESGDVVIGAPEAEDDHRVDINDRGLLLMPSAFIWPFVATMFREPAAPAVVYPSGESARSGRPSLRSAHRRWRP